MSKSRTKKLRAAFEARNGFTPLQRDSDIYKYHWRRFKKDFHAGRLVKV